MQNKKLIVLIILSIAAILSLIYGIVTPAKVRHKFIPELQDSQGKKLTITLKITRDKKRTNYTTWVRDPFSPQATSAIKSFRRPVLGGILWDEEKPMAIINDEVVKIGDKIGSNTVVDIKQDMVILSDGTSNFELRLGQQK